jgi:hypothetical protein
MLKFYFLQWAVIRSTFLFVLHYKEWNNIMLYIRKHKQVNNINTKHKQEHCDIIRWRLILDIYVLLS